VEKKQKNGKNAPKTVEEINRRIRGGDAVVLTAAEMKEYVAQNGASRAAREVDVVTTGTFGVMCSSGAFLNFGHSEPPIKMQKVWLNDVEAYTGVAAVDAYLGATQMSETAGFAYGGGHVIEDLVLGKEVELRATSYGTDCYPRKSIETWVGINDLNQATLLNPRNCYQKYACAANTSDKSLWTYMGNLQPALGSATYAGAGELNPLCNDPAYRTIGLGTRIFLGGGEGYVIGEGTQHNPRAGFGTLSVRGDLKQMSPAYLRGASLKGYGTSLYVGIGIPIPVLDEDLARSTAVRDSEIFTEVLDYGVAQRNRPVLAKVSYAQLRSGSIEINGRQVPTRPTGIPSKASQVAEELKRRVASGAFLLSAPVARLSLQSQSNTLKLRKASLCTESRQGSPT
jgi:uncharacterized protein (DUF39 family)